jgi:hypothetical protein
MENALRWHGQKHCADPAEADHEMQDGGGAALGPAQQQQMPGWPGGVLTAGTFTSTVMGWEAPLPFPLLMVVL